MSKKIRNYCSSIYSNVFDYATSELKATETQAQKEAIKSALFSGIKNFPNVEVADIWRTIYETHVHRKSGIDDAEIIAKVISADQSWKKSSGHAFEELIKFWGNEILNRYGIEILLQRDLNELINQDQLANDIRDINWLKTQIQSSVFDLYAIINANNNKKLCYGCIQSKTSIRDRVTRDREPSLNAMKNFFWSTIIVLDGDFLRLPKFTAMVSGGTAEYLENGWHGLYVFSDKYSGDRIYSTDINLRNFAEHAIKAASYWLENRQWFNENWQAD